MPRIADGRCVCLLPKTVDHARQLKIIENEIAAMAGQAVILGTVAPDHAQKDKVPARLKADRDAECNEFLGKCDDFQAEIAKETAACHFTYAELEENDADLKKLQTWLEEIRKLDFYYATLAAPAGERLRDCKSLPEASAKRVFDAHDENK